MLALRTGLFIGGTWRNGRGPTLVSRNPVTQETVWQGSAANSEDVHDALVAARTAFDAWADASLEERIAVVRRFAEQLKAGQDKIQ
jgi:succinylglutamic semialdehyde dehydrogenase